MKSCEFCIYVISTDFTSVYLKIQYPIIEWIEGPVLDQYENFWGGGETAVDQLSYIYAVGVIAI